jgi:hypothetical protein
MNEYSHDDKKKLAQQISKIRNKKDAITIYKIILKYNNDLPTREISKKTNLFFHNLKSETYDEINKFIKLIKKKKKKSNKTDSNTSYDYQPYVVDDFNQKDIKPKYKLSNKEKNIIKRKNYNSIDEENTDVIYQKF